MSDEIIHELLKEVREDQKLMKGEIQQQGLLLHNIQQDVSQNTVTLAKNTQDVAHHIKRTDDLQKLHESNEERIRELEKPGIALSFLKKIIVGLGLTIVGGMTIYNFFVGQ